MIQLSLIYLHTKKSNIRPSSKNWSNKMKVFYKDCRQIVEIYSELVIETLKIISLSLYKNYISKQAHVMIDQHLSLNLPKWLKRYIKLRLKEQLGSNSIKNMNYVMKHIVYKLTFVGGDVYGFRNCGSPFCC